MKRRGSFTAWTWSMIALVMLVASSVNAQEDTVTYTFRVTVEGEPCADATYWAVIGIPESEGYTVQLTDPDGDRVYTGSEEFTVGNDVFLSLQQGVGSVPSEVNDSLFPGEPVVTLRDLGRITPTEDTLVEARGRGCQPRLPDTGADQQIPFALFAGVLLAMLAGAAWRRHAAYN